MPSLYFNAHKKEHASAMAALDFFKSPEDRLKESAEPQSVDAMLSQFAQATEKLTGRVMQLPLGNACQD